MDKIFLSLIVLVFGTFIASLAQLLLKTAAVKEYPTRIKQYLNLRVLSGYTVMLASMAASLFAFRALPFSYAPVADAAALLFTVSMSAVVLKEKLTRKKISGILVVIIGIVIIAI